jgi:hypothetical protein
MMKSSITNRAALRASILLPRSGRRDRIVRTRVVTIRRPLAAQNGIIP